MARQAMRYDLKHSRKIIDALGGNAAISRRCGVTKQAVSDWRRKGIPTLRIEWLKKYFKNEVLDKASI